jgi:hypothetical protein
MEDADMTTDNTNNQKTIEHLKRMMHTAAISDDVAKAITMLRVVRGMIDNDQAYVLALALCAGVEIATNEGIEDRERETHLEQVVEMLRGAYQRALEDKEDPKK